MSVEKIARCSINMLYNIWAPYDLLSCSTFRAVKKGGKK